MNNNGDNLSNDFNAAKEIRAEAFRNECKLGSDELKTNFHRELPREYKLIDGLVEEIILEYKISIPIEDMSKVVNRIGGRVEYINNANHLINGTIRKEKDSFVIYVESYKNCQQQNFSIAHDLGHVFIHMGYKIDSKLWSKYKDGEYFAPTLWDQVNTANKFAYSLLMPRKYYKEYIKSYIECRETSGHPEIYNTHLNVKSVAVHFGVSISAAHERGKLLGFLKDPF